jgi:hypothetical protein
MSSANRSKIRPWVPTPEQQAWLHATDATSDFLRNLPDDVRQQYGGLWIAARECRIIASAPTMAELYEKLTDPNDTNVLVLRLERGVSIRWRRS